MRRIVLAGVSLLILSSTAVAQNKTLGVGVASPNPNAALHVESPTGNQGFILPRLTTLQRLDQDFISALGAPDDGLMVYDIDLHTIFVWNGSGWQNTAQVSGGGQYEVSASTGSAGIFTLTDGTNPSNAIEVTTSGVGSAGKFTVNNTGSLGPAIWAETNSNEPLSAAIYGLNTGTGDVAASFRVTNPANGFPAVFAETSGSGRVATFRKLGTNGNQPAIYVDSQGGHGIWADHNGSAGYAAIIQNINDGNPNAAMFVEAMGSGQSLWVQKSLETSTGDVIVSEHLGSSGRALNLLINNTENPSPALLAATNGTGAAIEAENSSNANAFAGSFRNTGSGNTYPAIQASTAGSGSGVRVMQTNATGPGIDVFMQNTSSSADGFYVDQRGTGHAGSFVVNNPSSNMAAVNVVTNGVGAALYAANIGSGNSNAGLIEITSPANTYPALQVNTAGTGSALNARHTGSSGDALYAEHTGGNGSAGNFRISNNSNLASSISASTTAPAGYAVSASNEANGIAFAVWSGGLQIRTEVVNATPVTTRASAYRVTGGGTSFALSFTPADGEVFLVYNETGQSITFAGVTVADGEGKTFVAFPGGVIRGF